MERTAPTKPELSEKGGLKEGSPQSSDRRLFMLLLAFGNARQPVALTEPIRAVAQRQGKCRFVLYEDLRDPTGVALLTIGEDPGQIMADTRQIVAEPAFAPLIPKPEFTMLGRTYSLGYEPDLDETLLHRPARTALNPDWPWAIWYPLRRSGQFTQLLAHEQRAILQEHGQIGMAFGYHDLAHDIRLASYGLDTNDNDFVIGLTGKELFPLSAIVQAMRKTQQTSLYLTSLGPFFVGKALWRG
jgi:chlorite dismutase